MSEWICSCDYANFGPTCRHCGEPRPPAPVDRGLTEQRLAEIEALWIMHHAGGKASEAVPDLLDEVRRLKGQVERVEALAERYAAYGLTCGSSADAVAAIAASQLIRTALLIPGEGQPL